MKYNKKRNSAFLYETLIKELTKSIIEENQERSSLIKSLLKEYFRKGTILNKALSYYRDLADTQDIDEPHVADRIIQEAKFNYSMLSPKEVFNAQTALIDSINKKLGSSVFSNFVPNYRHLGTVDAVLRGIPNVKKRVLIEEGLVKRMCGADRAEPQKKLEPLDKLAYKRFIKRFNEEYGGMLSEGQKRIMGKYIVSFSDEGVEFKVAISEKIEQFKTKLESYTHEDERIVEGVGKILEKFNGFRGLEVNEELLLNTLRLQSLIEEMESGD